MMKIPVAMMGYGLDPNGLHAANEQKPGSTIAEDQAHMFAKENKTAKLEEAGVSGPPKAALWPCRGQLN